MKKTSEGDLFLSMTKRLNTVEKQYREEKEKNKILQEELNNLKKLFENNPSLSVDNLNEICRECIKLKNQINNLKNYVTELKEFISEKGFVCLTNNQETFEEDYDLNCEQRQIPKEIDINIVSKRIEEMNFLTIKDGNSSNFEKDSDGVFKLKFQKELKFFFYKDGLVIETYKFYNYNSIEAKRILHDILDGYIPYILQSAYPKGILLKVVNCLHKNFSSEEDFNVKNLNTPKVKSPMTGDKFLEIFPEKFIILGKTWKDF